MSKRNRSDVRRKQSKNNQTTHGNRGTAPKPSGDDARTMEQVNRIIAFVDKETEGKDSLRIFGQVVFNLIGKLYFDFLTNGFSEDGFNAVMKETIGMAIGASVQGVVRAHAKLTKEDPNEFQIDSTMKPINDASLICVHAVMDALDLNP